MRLKIWITVILFTALFFPVSLYAQELVVIGYNVESGDADPQVVAQRIKEIDGCDIWGLSEVQNQQWANTFEAAAEDGENADFKPILGNTGGADKLLIIYDSDKLELLDSFELNNINIGGNVRAPLVAKFKFISNGAEFFFMANHLYRTKDCERYIQAALLNAWAAAQKIPIIAVGDYNFDWSVTNGDTNHDSGYDYMTTDAVFQWVRPTAIVKTQASSENSVLDFVFASGDAKAWAISSTILVKQGDFPDDANKSDHRPVRARFDLSGAVVSKQEIIDRIKELKTEVERLEELVERLPE